MRFFAFFIKIRFFVLYILLCGMVFFLPSFLGQAVFTDAKSSDYIKWVDFTPTEKVLSDCYAKDVEAYKSGKSFCWIDALSYLAAKYGGDFSRYKKSDLTAFEEKVLGGGALEEITKDMKYFDYYKKAYDAVLGGFVGEFEIEKESEGQKIIEKKYGLKAFSPIAKGYSYSHYDDFGSSRSYGYRRRHLGHDLMGSVGTPIIAVESGVVEALGWNRYGGWRIGIRSFDKKRYYYYAHLRRDHPYSDELYEGKTVTAGDVIGYLGMTGYSIKENVNNINTPHLHYGMQLIFDESQKEGSNEIWIDMFAITNFLQRNTSAVVKDLQTGEYVRKYLMFEEKTLD